MVKKHFSEWCVLYMQNGCVLYMQTGIYITAPCMENDQAVYRFHEIAQLQIEANQTARPCHFVIEQIL